MKKRVTYILLLAMFLMPAALFAILNSESGSRWLIQQILASLPAKASVKHIEGCLLKDITLKEFHYQTETETIAITHFTLVWHPSELLSGHLHIAKLEADGIAIDIVPSATAESSSPFAWDDDLSLPLRLTIDTLAISRLHYQSGASQFGLDYLNLSAFTEQNRLNLTSLTAATQAFQIKAEGTVRLGRQFPFSLKTHWQFDDQEYGQWQADTELTGDVNQLNINNRQSSPFMLNLKGDITELQNQPNFKLHGNWQQLKWPLTGQPTQFVSPQGFFEIKGPLDDYRVTLQGPLTQDYLPEAKLLFNGHGNSETINIDSLQIASNAGSFAVQGQAGWAGATAFAITVTGQDFNPAILVADLPGKLTFKVRLDGEFSEAAHRMQADIDQFGGSLRGKPVTAQGKLGFSNDKVQISQLSIRSGPNRIDADGKLDPVDSNLKFVLDTPNLSSLWPGLAGSLKGDGQILGHWQNPLLHIQAKGNRLQFENFGIATLQVFVDYGPDANKLSKLHLHANRLKTGDMQIDALTIEGTGTPAKHQFNLNLNNSVLALSSTLNGMFEADSWQGNLIKLNLAHRDSGTWQLREPAQLKTSKQAAGLDTNLSPTCIERNNAFLCINGAYHANNDFAAQLKASGLPLDLLSAYLPVSLQIKGRLDAAIQLSQQNNALTGAYTIVIPANPRIVVKDQQLQLGKFTLEGKLQDSLLSADADLALAGSDYLRANMNVHTQTAGPLSGRITASINDWSIFQPFIPAISNLKGQLLADLNLQGSTASPRIAGNLDLQGGSVELKQSGIGLTEIDLHILGRPGLRNELELTGAFTPQFLAEADSNYHREFNGRLNLKANLRQKLQGWFGDGLLTIPANASLAIKTPDQQIALRFAASSLSGEIDGDLINSGLDLRLLNQDYLRAELQADLGSSQKLFGQIGASFQDLSLLNALTPELSDVKGQIKAELNITGTTNQPKPSGAVQLKQASLNVNDLGISVQDIDLQILASAEPTGTLQLNGNAQSGNGTLSWHGMSDFNGNAEINLYGDDFEIAKLPNAQVTISPKLEFKLAETGAKIDGAILIPKAQVVLKELPENTVTVSEDEIILGQAKPEPASALGIDTNIEIELGDEVSFLGFGLSTNLAGRLKLMQANQQASLHGEIDMKKGRYQSYGQDLTIRKGRFIFNGPIDAPWLDVEASRLSKDQTVTAILSVTGPLKTPKTRIYSEPALSESDALAYLITGSPLNQVGKSDGNMVASAALSYGVGQMSWLRDKFGIDEFEVKQGQTLQDTLVAVGQYLTPDFYVGTKVGIFNNQAVLVLKQRLTPSFTVESQSGTSQRIKLNYEIETD